MWRVQVLRLLLAHCESEEECRNVVAECLGHLALLHADQVLPPLQAQAAAASASMRAAVVTAIKCMLLPQPHAIDPLLRAAIPAFLALVSDPDRRALLGPPADTPGSCLALCSSVACQEQPWHPLRRLAKPRQHPAVTAAAALQC